MPETYQRPARPHAVSLEIKRSQFICQAAHTVGAQAANDFVLQVRNRYPDANHNCWCYVAGAPDDYNLWNCSDDGEPRGTAGKPMLNVLAHSGLGEITLVVTRYFGGVKLGAGGLVRAYSQAVQECLASLPTETRVFTQSYELLAPHDLTGTLEHLIQQLGLTVIERQWRDKLRILLELSDAEASALEMRLAPLPATCLAPLKPARTAD
ncbi:YigZ family protein [Marinobacterium rhizophilum]|uniref:YigZ family protein n=1 Tax=Marinobacterium rhizophilum TaxID=420402 RepID=A0ABY5HNH3_9GAMM|nr:YigZ family protein [Marinobacterium rhizophilum]UTW13327.1 YigZ family protein [Marinobacterium rhizophilum]